MVLRAGETLKRVAFPPDIAVPEPLRELYDYRRQYCGLLMDILRKTKKHPASAVSLTASANKPKYRVGEDIQLRVALKSVGTRPVAIPSLVCQELVEGCVVVDTVDPRVYGPPPPVCKREFGVGIAHQGRVSETLTRQAIDDLENVIVLAPGDEYELPFPRPIPADRLGILSLDIDYNVMPRYPKELISQEVGADFVARRVATQVVVRIRD